jgi:CubicO group peptidase (beta-lactamase class C family)
MVRRSSESPSSELHTNTSRTDETVYRLGSVSKLLFLYTFLVEVGHAHWHRPITEFIPELAEAAESCSAELDPLTCPDWHEITLGALASHLAGLGRGGPFASAPTAIGGVPVTELGLPPQPLIEIKQCESQPCTRAEELRAFLQEPPLEAAFSVPIYSNGGYQILAYALEAITNRTMSDMIFNDVFCPLEMVDSSYTLKNGTAAVVPGSVDLSGWSMPLGDAGPAGGMYSSPRDMVKLGQSILSNKQLSPAATRRWLKPWAPTAVWQQAIGLAWEIAKWPVHGRVVDVYTKQGDLGMFMFSALCLQWWNWQLTTYTGAYHSRFAIIPDYNVGVVVLSAGSGGPDAQVALFETVLADLLPGLEATARSQAEGNLVGTYVSSSPDVNTTITFATEPNFPGLKVTSFISNSSDVLNSTLLAVTHEYSNPDVRLYPTELVRKTGSGSEIRKYNAVVNNPDVVFPNGQMEAMNCMTWALVGAGVYGAIALDEVWIEADASGKGVGVEMRAFGAKMQRASQKTAPVGRSCKRREVDV